MIKFKLIDVKTGKEISADKIYEIARDQEMMDVAVDQFFIGEDGQLILVDDCDNIAHCDMEKIGLVPVLKGKYPDLEYLEAMLLGNLRKLHPEAFISGLLHPQAELVEMFSQTWPNTAGGFSEPGMMSGQAFTTQITTVMRVYIYDAKKEYYGVFFDNKPAYIVSDANNTFLKDLKDHNLKSKYDAQKVY